LDNPDSRLLIAGVSGMGYLYWGPAAIILLMLLLFFEKKAGTTGKLLTKTPLSLLFVTVGIFHAPWPPHGFPAWLLAGLVLCLMGDVLLALPGKTAFRMGLAAFLLGHVGYIAAFGYRTGPGAWWFPSALVVVGLAVVVVVRLWPFLGALRAPVLLYVAAISLMVIAAAAVLREDRAGGPQPIMVFVGAVLFYVSDLFVARDRFVARSVANRVFGLPLYYAGQFLLAHTAGMV
jgi:uncharacterized membrane protein YhhN